MSTQTFGTSIAAAATFAQQAKNTVDAAEFGVLEGFRFIKSPDLEQQVKIRRAIKLNERKARTQSGKHRGRKWLLSKQAQCAIYGHVHGQNGMACYYCGYEFE